MQHNIDALVWHYTTGAKFLQIVESGFLLPTGVYVAPPELPVLWFSTNQYFDPTARKGIIDQNGFRTASMIETKEKGRGLFRFGYPKNKLLTGLALRKAALIPKQMWIALSKVALQQGSNSSWWYGTTEPIAVEDLVVEVMNAEMQWERVQPKMQETA